MLVRNLLGALDLADGLGFEFPQSIFNLRKRDVYFPDPVTAINAMHHARDWTDVQTLTKANGRKTADGVPARAPRSNPAVYEDPVPIVDRATGRQGDVQ